MLETAREIEDEEERRRELEEIEAVFRPYEDVEGERMLTVIQTMDPPGIGARNVQESILIQLRQRDEEGSVAYRLIEDHFDALINHRWNDIARDLGISPKRSRTRPTRSVISIRNPG